MLPSGTPASIIRGSSFVIEKAVLLEFSCRSLRRIYCDSTTHVEFACMTRGQFFMARGVREGCLASGFLFAMSFDPIFRWLQDAIIPRNLAGLYFFQPGPCAYAAVAASSFRRFMALFHTVRVVLGSTWIIGNVIGAVRQWKLPNFFWIRWREAWEFRENWIVRYVKYVGIMKGLECYMHRWKRCNVFRNMNTSTKSMIERLCDLKMYVCRFWVNLDSYARQTKLPLRLRPMPYNVLPQVRTMPFLLTSYVLFPFVALDLLGIHSISVGACFWNSDQFEHTQQRLWEDSGSSWVWSCSHLFSSPNGKTHSCSYPWLVALWKRSILYDVSIAVANWMVLHSTKGKRLPQLCSVTNYKRRTLLIQFLYASPEILDKSVAFTLRRFFFRWNSRHVLLVLGSMLVSYASSAMVFVRHKDSTSSDSHRWVEFCPDKPDCPSLLWKAEWPVLFNLFASIWGQATEQPRKGDLSHLITQVFLRRLQNGIVVMCVIDAFVHVHHRLRRHIENAGNCGDCM